MTTEQPLVFRPFKLELAGSHDGTRAKVSLSFSTNAMVVNHEATHERLFATTADGQLLAALARLVLNKNNSDQEFPPNLSIVAKMLFDASEWAHEVIATYYGIKMLPSASESTAISSLPPDYENYYKALSDVIDPVFYSSYMQSLIGWNIGAVAFSSPLLSHFVAINFGESFTLSDDEHPEKRMHALIKVLKNNDLSDLQRQIKTTAEVTSQTLGFEPWDLQSDEAWEAHHDIGASIETAISAVVRTWLQQKSGLPVLTENAQRGALDRLAALVQPYGLLMESPDAIDVFNLQYPHDELVETVWQAASITENSRGDIILPDADNGVLVTQGELFLQTLHSFQVISAPPPNHLSECYVLAWHEARDTGDFPTIAGRSSTADMLKWLALRRDHEQRNSPVPDVCAITIAVQNFKDLSKIMPDIIRATTFGDGTGARYGSAARGICWYWTSNWLEVVHSMAKSFPVQIATFYPESMKSLAAQERTGRAFDQFPELCVKALKVPNVPGFIIRLFNFRAMAYVNSYEAALRAKGIIHDLDEDVLDYASSVIGFAVTSIREFWPTF